VVYRTVSAAFVACLAAIVLTSTPVETRMHWYSGEGYDWWTDCSDVPDTLEFLPIYLANDSPGFVDLRRTVSRSGLQWRVMQYTRDKDMGPTRISTGIWYGGMGADEWPSGSLDARRLLERFRVTSWEIDGTRHAVDPSCVVILSTDDQTIGFYNAWVRFTEAGLHTLKITGRQVSDFYFVYPFANLGVTDPFGLEGRRVFLAGESLGEALDDEFTHTYELHVGKD
jgi:hypothetical protein